MIFVICRDLEDAKETEELDWIESQFKGLIIGSRGKGLRDLEFKTGAKVYKQRNSIFVHGTKYQRDDVKDVIQRKIVRTVDKYLSIRLFLIQFFISLQRAM